MMPPLGKQAGWAKIARRIRVPLGFAFAGLYLVLAKPSWLSLLMGILVVASGIALRAAASGHVKKNTELTITGPYAYTRNPLYLGSLCIAIGFGVAGRNPWIAVAIFVFLVMIYYPVILSEEDYLRSRFPEFGSYQARVPRLFPKFKADGNAGSFSRELYLQHREYNSLIGAILLTIVLIAKMLLFPRI